LDGLKLQERLELWLFERTTLANCPYEVLNNRQPSRSKVKVKVPMSCAGFDIVGGWPVRPQFVVIARH
jgi:hypothetical protein